jgi:acetyltransferase-like isoleucine patch superfamily enzyme
MTDHSYYRREELAEMGFRSLGQDVKISRTARLYSPASIAIGDHSMVDDFCVLMGQLDIGRNVHIAHGCRVMAGRDGIRMQDFCGLAFGVTIFAQSDDYSGATLTNPTVPKAMRDIRRGAVEIGRHVIVGAHAMVFPGVILGEGGAIGAGSVVKRSTEPWSIYAGSPARRVRERLRDLLALEREYLREGLHNPVSGALQG